MKKKEWITRIAWTWCAACTLAASASDRPQRPMLINSVHELGLEIWTEADPEWETWLQWHSGQATFTAETPAFTYPPAGMSWVSRAGIEFLDSELEEGARGAIHRAARNYGVQAMERIELEAARYGDLVGYQADFSASSQGVPVDVRVFCGHESGKEAVVMQAFTQGGKLEHISEHIRRSWTNVRYLRQQSSGPELSSDNK